MAAPSPPFATSEMVAVMLPTKLGREATDFTNDGQTTPSKAVVEQHIDWVSSQIEMQFGMAGYVVPLDEISGETWPTSQTFYLQFLTTLGTTAISGGYSLKPAPALSPSRGGGTGNVFQVLFDIEMKKIHWVSSSGRDKSTLRFRAAYYAGTPAEQLVTLPMGPTTDFMEGKFDPYRELSNWQIADKQMAIEQSMTDLNINWDHLYSLFDINKGLGVSIYE